MRRLAPLLTVWLAAATVTAQSGLSPKGPASSGAPAGGVGANAGGPVMAKASARYPEVQALVDACVEATGGAAAWSRLQGLETNWAWSLETQSGSLNAKANTSGAFRSEMSMNGSEWRESQGCNGTQAWVQDAAGVCHVASEVVRVQLQMQYNPAAMMDLSSYAKAMTTSGKVTVAGRPMWRVILIPKEGRSMYLFFDEETKLLSRWEFTRPTTVAPMVIERSYDDYRAVGDVMIPHTIRERSQAGTVEYQLQTVAAKHVPAEMLGMTECAKEAFALAAKEAQANTARAILPDGPMHENLVKLIGPELLNASGQPVDSRVLNDVPNVLLYFSAKWCAPCRRFTPQLVNYYEQAGKDRDFAVVLVSSDRSADKMLEYMKGSNMNWYTVPFERIQASGIKQAWGGRGIPNLVWLGPADQVIERSYVNGRYVGPNHVLKAFQSRQDSSSEATSSGS